jgi:hypothetical protein
MVGYVAPYIGKGEETSRPSGEGESKVALRTPWRHVGGVDA